MKSNHRMERRRPPLALRALVGAGRLVERLGVSLAALDEHELCVVARRKTGLSNFGDERFRPLFRRQLVELAGVLEHVGVLGRLMARAWLQRALRNRLLIEQRITDHPEILGVAVPRPIVIAGLARTGTTLLMNLLAQDPGCRPLVFGEGLSPARPLRLRQAARLVWLIKHLAPQLRSVYIIEPEAPVECGMLFRNSFLPRVATAPDLDRWCEAFSPATWEWAYTEYYRQLQLLEWQRPAPDHWLLKWPEHLFALDILVKTVPGAAIVQTHRDPAQVVPAMCQALGRFGFLLSDDRWEHLPQHMMAITAEGLRRAMDARQRIPPHRLFDVSYRRLVADPIGVVRDLYDHLGYRYSDEFESRARRWLEQHPAPRHGERYYDLEPLGLDRASVERSFAFYYQQYRIEASN